MHQLAWRVHARAILTVRKFHEYIRYLLALAQNYVQEEIYWQ